METIEYLQSGTLQAANAREVFAMTLGLGFSSPSFGFSWFRIGHFANSFLGQRGLRRSAAGWSLGMYRSETGESVGSRPAKRQCSKRRRTTVTLGCTQLLQIPRKACCYRWPADLSRKNSDITVDTVTAKVVGPVLFVRQVFKGWRLFA
jgi:hypothetical protein